LSVAEDRDQQFGIVMRKIGFVFAENRTLYLLLFSYTGNSLVREGRLFQLSVVTDRLESGKIREVEHSLGPVPSPDLKNCHGKRHLFASIEILLNNESISC